MRYYPIGFDPELTAGSSDQEMLDTPAAEFRRAVSISSSLDSSKDEDLDSDTAIPPSKSRTKSKALTFESTKADERPTKRKHSEGEKKKSKHSSSKSATVTDDRKLKRIKIQVEKQKTRDSQSASTELRSIASTILPPGVQTSTRIVPPSTETTNSKIAIPPAAVLSSDQRLETQIREIDPNLTEKGRKMGMKRLKKSLGSSVTKTKPREEKADALSEPSLSHMLSSEEQVRPSEEKKKRRKDQVANGVKERRETAEKTSLPRSTTPILPPKHAAKR